MVSRALSERRENEKPIRIIFIDDEKDEAELVGLNLKGTNLDVATVSTPREALTLLKGQSFDCVVSDYMMPEMNGIQLCTEIRRTSNIPFIIYTAYDSAGVANSALAAGVDYYIQKKQNIAHFQNLASSIEHAIEMRRQ